MPILYNYYYLVTTHLVHLVQVLLHWTYSSLFIQHSILFALRKLTSFMILPPFFQAKLCARLLILFQAQAWLLKSYFPSVSYIYLVAI